MGVEEKTVIILFGASGDLACKKIFPALYELLKNTKNNIKIIGFGRSKKTKESLLTNVKSLDINEFNNFLHNFIYYEGDYQDNIFQQFDIYINNLLNTINHNRIYYLALPPSIFSVVASLCKRLFITHTGYSRIVVEKPFGYDLNSFRLFNTSLLELYHENDIYRIDHYLGKEMVQNILALRFANDVFNSIWNRQHISCVMISFKENIGTYGRANYYDQSGVIRDIVQNHMMQVLSLLAMEQPISLLSEHIKDAKCQVLQNILPIQLSNVVIGQYIGKSDTNDKLQSLGYKDDPLIPKDSITPTFIDMIIYIDNDRWRGVPFILKAGKALKERKAEVRIQFTKNLNLFNYKGFNELVIQMQPTEAIYLKIMNKVHGPGFQLHTTELDLTYKERYKEYSSKDAYEKLILDIIQGEHMNFVRSDELEQSWKIFTPLLQTLQDSSIQPIPYQFGERGPKQADTLNFSVGFQYDPNYKWDK